MAAEIPFTKVYFTGKELEYIRAAIETNHLSGDGAFTRLCHQWLEKATGCHRALLTHSCTAALEMAALLAEVGPGDEVIMPSFTFVSTANAFVLRGATPVFVDVEPDTFNIDAAKIAEAVTERTRVIVPVHYAGVGCDMDAIMDIARRHDLIVIEDAAQAILSTYKGRPLGSIGHLAAVSFHETKNVMSGEGGALLINDPSLEVRAEIIREKGTNRSLFFRGMVDKYTWVDVGSSYLPSELVAAFLLSQLEEADAINERRRGVWEAYHAAFEPLENAGRIRRPRRLADRTANAHIYYLLLENLEARTDAIARLSAAGVNAVFHYVPLHSSPAGLRFGRAAGPLPVTERVGDCLLRLPLWPAMQQADVDRVVNAVFDAVGAPVGIGS